MERSSDHARPLGRSATAAKLLYASCLATFAMNVPILSGFVILLLAATLPIHSTVDGLLSPPFLRRLALLLVFLGVYYVTMLSFGLTSFTDASKYSMYAIASYLLGYSAARAVQRGRTGLATAGLLGAVTGSVVFVTMCVGSAGASLASAEIVDRAAPAIWSDGGLVNGPALGIQASLGMCLIPAVLFLSWNPSSWGLAWRAFFAAVLGVLGLYANFALQNRTPFLALAAALLGCIFVSSRALSPRRLLVRCLTVAAFVAGAYALGGGEMIQSHGLYYRFAREGLETARYDVWGRVLAGILDAPWGGRDIYLGGIRYAHNLWLDVAYDAGVVPFVLLLAFHAAHVRPFATVMRCAPHADRLLFIALLASMLASFIGEPVIEASMIYFSVTCYYFGAIAGGGSLQNVRSGSGRAIA